MIVGSCRHELSAISGTLCRSAGMQYDIKGVPVYQHAYAQIETTCHNAIKGCFIAIRNLAAKSSSGSSAHERQVSGCVDRHQAVELQVVWVVELAQVALPAVAQHLHQKKTTLSGQLLKRALLLAWR